MKSFRFPTILIILIVLLSGCSTLDLKSKLKSNLKIPDKSLALYEQEPLVKKHPFISLSVILFIFFLIKSYLSNRKLKFYYNLDSEDISLLRLSIDTFEDFLKLIKRKKISNILPFPKS